MSTFNTTLTSPDWAEGSILDDDGRYFKHHSADFSEDPEVLVQLERLDVLDEKSNTWPVGGYSICVSMPGQDNVQIDLDDESVGNAAAAARRLAAQLLLAADKYEEVSK